MTIKNCFYCKLPSKLYLKSSNKQSSKSFNFASTEIDTYDSEIKPDLYYCKECEIIFSEFVDRKFEDNYKDVLDELYIEQIENKKKYFKNIINKLSNIITSQDDVIEIGSYYGAFGSQIKDKVRSYTGLELSTHASKYAKDKFNLNIENKSIFNFFENSLKKFDIIFMFDVIEHLDDPNEVIKLCSKNLKQNGKIVMSTMNMDSIFARATRSYYPWIIPMHKFYFTNHSIKKILNKNNLSLDNILMDIRIISLKYLFLKISQKITFFKFFYKILIKFEFLKNLSIKFTLLDINIYIGSKFK